MKYVFGPVNSRRLGVSLGLDIIPLKVCSFNCIYCECGATDVLTDEVKEYLPYDEIIAEITQVLSKKPRIDVVTFSGSGEPTLNSRIGDIIKFIKTAFPEYKVAVLTNSSLLYRQDVRKRLLEADIICPSLDAVSDEVFNRIMRPVTGTDPETIVDSIVLLRDEFKGKLCLEIFIIAGLNDTDAELGRLKEACIKIRPDEIHLNSLDRPGAEDWVNPPGNDNMERVKKYFNNLPVKLVGKVNGSEQRVEYFYKYEDYVFDAIGDDGSSAEELAVLLDMRKFDVLKSLKSLIKQGRIEKIYSDNREVYRRVS